jgi:hypothetical protein
VTHDGSNKLKNGVSTWIQLRRHEQLWNSNLPHHEQLRLEFQSVGIPKLFTVAAEVPGLLARQLAHSTEKTLMMLLSPCGYVVSQLHLVSTVEVILKLNWTESDVLPWHRLSSMITLYPWLMIFFVSSSVLWYYWVIKTLMMTRNPSDHQSHRIGELLHTWDLSRIWTTLSPLVDRVLWIKKRTGMTFIFAGVRLLGSRVRVFRMKRTLKTKPSGIGRQRSHPADPKRCRYDLHIRRGSSVRVEG